MPKRNKASIKRNKPLDTFSAKRARGRPARMRASEILGRAAHYRLIFHQVWDRLWPLLLKARTEVEVKEAFLQGATPYDGQFLPWVAGLALQVLRESRFPKRSAAQIGFFADSLAGVGAVTPRRSRDICAQEKAREKRTHRIISYEFWIECSCSYKGQSRDHACPDCGARIVFETDSLPISAFMA
jgi:hypothetical protein